MKVLFEDQTLIHFGDTDPQGFIYFARAMDLAHKFLEKFWAQTSFGWKYWFQNPEFAVPIRHAECDFLKPLLVGELYQLRLFVSKMGDSSIEFTCEFVSPKGDHEICARITTIHVFVDRKTLTKITIPPEVKNLVSPSHNQ